MKKILATTSAILMMATLIGCTQPIDVETAEAISMSADDFVNMFDGDEDKIEKDNKDKVFEITGVLSDINSNLSITLTSEEGIGDEDGCSLRFSMDRDKSENLPELNEGDTVTIKGKFSHSYTYRLDFDNSVYISSVKATEPATTENTDIELNKDSIVTLLDMSMAQGFEEDCYSVEYNDELGAYVISMWQENFVEMLAMAEGNEEVKNSWYEMVDSLKTSCNGMSESVKTMGDDSSSVIMNILNDENKDNVLLTIADGEVIYDVLAE